MALIQNLSTATTHHDEMVKQRDDDYKVVATPKDDVVTIQDKPVGSATALHSGTEDIEYDFPFSAMYRY
ncbi:hypothetical protein DYB32_004375, partial [Aphanomyces invadans]